MVDEPLLEVGRIGRAHGLRGALYVHLITDRTERVAPGARLQAKETWLTVRSARPAAAAWLVQFVGLDDRTAAEVYRDTPLMAEPLPPLSDDGWYVRDLIGSSILGVDGTNFGTCVAVIGNPAHDLLELESGALVPVVFITEVAPGQVTINPPEGLFDLLE